MATPLHIALKNGRKKAKMTAKQAAIALHLDERTVLRYEEENGVKYKDPKIILAMADLYKDVDIRIAYFNQDIIFVDTFGELTSSDPIHATMEYSMENEDDTQIMPELKEWGRKDGSFALSERAERETRESNKATMNFVLTHLQVKKERSRFAFGSAQTQ